MPIRAPRYRGRHAAAPGRHTTRAQNAGYEGTHQRTERGPAGYEGKRRAEPAGKHRAVPQPPPAPRPNVRKKQPANTRAQLTARAEAFPPVRPGIRQTPADDRPEPNRNYPPKGRSRTNNPTAKSRAQLAERDRVRGTQGHPATKPHPKSNEGARSTVKAKGTARRPPSVLPGNPPAGRHRESEQANTGWSFASGFFK